MALCKLNRPRLIRTMCYDVKPDILNFYCKTFDVPPHRIQSIFIKNPNLRNMTEEHINAMVDVFDKFKLPKQEILEKPRLLNIHPLTIENRLMVLNECGFHKVDCKILSRYVQILGKEYFYQLQKKGLIEDKHILYQHLVECFRDWPNMLDHLTINIPNVERLSLWKIRMYILKKFLKAKYKMPNEKFQFILKTYTQIKHKPFEKISSSLYLLEKEFSAEIPIKKILLNGFIFQVEPENIIGLLNEVKTFGGVDIKELIRLYPSILRTNYKHILENKKILREAEISEESQKRCLEICRLSPVVLQERINVLKSSNSFKGYAENFRVLKLIYHYNKVFERMESFSESNKKCKTIHILTTTNKQFNRFLKSPDDKSKGVDIINALKSFFKTIVDDKDDVKNQLLRHPLWTHGCLSSIIEVFEYLSQHFDNIDIFHNCPLLLYQLNDVENIISNYFNYKKTGHNEDPTVFSELAQLKLNAVNGRQVLSLVLYYLERPHNFAGYGIIQKQKLSNEI